MRAYQFMGMIVQVVVSVINIYATAKENSLLKVLERGSLLKKC